MIDILNTHSFPFNIFILSTMMLILLIITIDNKLIDFDK